MKLNIVPARDGATWAMRGITTFFKQPLALSGLFFMFMALLSIATLVPFIGAALALALLPAATLGLMAATQEASRGKFPMPTILISAFRAGRQQLRAMAVLGALYAVGFGVLMGISALIDGGQFAGLYLFGGHLSEELVMQGDFQAAMWVTLLLYAPLSLLFWHAPALVHWYDMPPAKALFISMVACISNFKAYFAYGLAWMAVLFGASMVLGVVMGLLGLQAYGRPIITAFALSMAAMTFASVYFTFRDSFVHTDNNEFSEQTPTQPHPPAP